MPVCATPTSVLQTSRRTIPSLVLTTVMTAVSFARAQSLGVFNPPWHEAPMVPLPAATVSLEVREFDTPVWASPLGERRGSLLAGTRLPIYGSRRGSGECSSRWFLVGPLAWVCGDAVDGSAAAPTKTPAPTSSDGLPFRYYFVGEDGAFGYSALSLVGEGIPDSQLEPGFAVAATREVTSRGERLVYTTNGLWIPAHDLVPVVPSGFEGFVVSPGATADVAWTIKAGVYTFGEPFGQRRRKLQKLTRLTLIGQEQRGRTSWLQLGEGDWVRAEDVRAPTLGPWPNGVGETERWIDVDTRSQVLTAFVGATPAFITLVSTGTGRGDADTATPVGEHRIWVKLHHSDMTNVEDLEASQLYAIEAVPWVQFFKGGYGLHAAFWHEGFGSPRSHGCVNLSPKDAAFLFAWTQPSLPVGWHAVLPTAAEPGTLVRVR